MKRTLCLAALAATVFAADRGGVRPRTNANDYPAHETARDVSVAAAVISPDQAKSLFSTDLSQYVVLEVGLFPAANQTIDVNSGDFSLRVGAQGDIVRAANPHAMAAANQRKNSPPPARGRDITLYPTATVGVATGPDPVTGQRRRGVYTETGVGVGIGDPGYPQPPRPGSTDRDREVMNQELSDKMLPDGPSDAPVAGYLYFRIPPKARTSALELQYTAPSGRVRVLLPSARAK